MMLQGRGFGDFNSIFLAEGRVRSNRCGRVGLRKNNELLLSGRRLKSSQENFEFEIACQNSPARTPKKQSEPLPI